MSPTAYTTPPNDIHLDTSPQGTPHPPTLRAPPYTHYRCNQRMPATYVCDVSLRRYDQHTSTTYTCNVCLQHISTTDTTKRIHTPMRPTYPYNIPLQRIPNTYPYNISLRHIPNTYLHHTPHPPMDISGNLW